MVQRRDEPPRRVPVAPRWVPFDVDAGDRRGLRALLLPSVANGGLAFARVWRGLRATQQGVLAAVADDPGALLSRPVLHDHGLRRGGGTSTALRALVDAGLVVRDDGRATRHRVVDPLLAVWLRGGRQWPG